MHNNINCATDTYSAVNNWSGIGSPDYYNSICPPSNNNVPFNRFGELNAINNGQAYIGIVTYYKTSEYKEYIQQQLSNPLIAGKSYYLSFHISKADRVIYSTNNTGAYFSVSQPTVTGNNYFSANPQIINNLGFISDTIIWSKIEGYFTAQGGEQYMTIGNFNSNANTDTLNSGTTNPIPFDPGEAYYYIDSVSLYDSLDYVTNIKKHENDFKVSVYPNPIISTLNIVDENNKLQNTAIEIKNYLGQTFHKAPFSNQIDLSNLATGMYFLSIEDKSNKKTVKVIKQ